MRPAVDVDGRPPGVAFTPRSTVARAVARSIVRVRPDAVLLAAPSLLSLLGPSRPAKSRFVPSFLGKKLQLHGT